MDEKTSEFLELLSNRYRHCDTYQDSGIIQSSMTTGATINNKRHCTFKTFYVRPGRLSIHLWSNEDENQLAAWLVYKNGEVHAIREGASIPVLKCDSIKDAIFYVTSYRKNTGDHFELAVPALLEKEIRLSSDSNFFDAHCFLLQELNSKFHLQKAVGCSLTNIWFRPDLSVHDVELKVRMSKDEQLELREAYLLRPEGKRMLEIQKELDPGHEERLREMMNDSQLNSRRVYSHVLFDQDIDESVFDIPET